MEHRVSCPDEPHPHIGWTGGRHGDQDVLRLAELLDARGLFPEPLQIAPGRIVEDVPQLVQVLRLLDQELRGPGPVVIGHQRRIIPRIVGGPLDRHAECSLRRMKLLDQPGIIRVRIVAPHPDLHLRMIRPGGADVHLVVHAQLPQPLYPLEPRSPERVQGYDVPPECHRDTVWLLVVEAGKEPLPRGHLVPERDVHGRALETH